MLEQRAQADIIGNIFDFLESKGWEKAISVGSFYTITYLTERILHEQGWGKPELIAQQRKILVTINITDFPIDNNYGIEILTHKSFIPNIA